MILDLANKKLGWPTRDEVLNPPGSGPKVYAHLADKKLGGPLRRLEGESDVHVGILAANPIANATEAPIALVCEFNRPVTPETLAKTHRLAWSFCRSPLLITLEPHMIRSWTCCEPPQREKDLLEQIKAEITEATVDLEEDPNLATQAAQSLRWVDLVSGEFYRSHEKRFPRKQCADYLLLENLKEVRAKLKNQELDYDTIHDLLARLIFIQFLFDRKDSSGMPALGSQKLNRLQKQGILSTSYTDLEGILQNYDDTYSLFRDLNKTFNGDLFPGKGETVKERDREWLAEMEKVEPRHLCTLAKFVSGDMKMKNGQLSLWREYSFDTIPLEFISSIYEEFVGKAGRSTGAHYTPAHIADFVLDRVLPWDSDEWNLKVLDPACGSGIFLVKAYQRLIHRWRNAHPKEEPNVPILKQLLTRNLFGVDKDPHAVRVASFSLYLAMCDEIDPRHYWTQVKFPRLRDRKLIAADFFQEDVQGFRTDKDANQYDLVVGNAPWGKKTETPAAEQWKEQHGWTTTYESIGPLFLPKAACLAKPGAQVAMLQPAGLIFQHVRPAKTFRAKLFSQFRVDEIVNLSALRFGLFKGAISPACFVSMRAMECDGEPLLYVSPKPTLTNEDDYRVIIEPHDMHFIQSNDAAHNPDVWTVLMWGGRRDLVFVRRLSRRTNLRRLEHDRAVKTRQGVIRGDKKRRLPEIVGMRMLDCDEPLDAVFSHLDAGNLPKNQDPSADSKTSTNMIAFQLPQLLVKRSWQQATRRFKAVLVRSDKTIGPVFCTQSYVSVHASQNSKAVLEAAWLALSSRVAVYYLLLTSSRFASFIPEPSKSDLMEVPIPEPQAGFLRSIKTYEDVDKRAYAAFGFNDIEKVLIEDLNDITLRDFKGDESSPGRRETCRANEEYLQSYCEYFSRVLRAGFGQDKKVCATIFQEMGESRLPIRLVAIHLGWPGTEKRRIERPHIEPIPQGKLRSRLQELNKKFLTTPEGREGGIFYQRVARVYDTVQYRGTNVPTVYLIKPDRLRYWTRSIGVRDADEVAADIMSWQEGLDSPPSATMENRIV